MGASKFTKKNPKLTKDMMVAVMVPYLCAALRHVDASTLRHEYEWINRELRARTDSCVLLEVPFALALGEWSKRTEAQMTLRFLLRDDTRQMAAWQYKSDTLTATVQRRVESRLRERLRRSAVPKIREFAKLWSYPGEVLSVELTPEEFGALVGSLTNSAAFD